MKEDFIIFLVVAALIMTFVIVGFSTGKATYTKRFQAEAIRLGHAQYNPTNATFEWRQCK